MSEDFLIVVPRDPRHLPDAKSQGHLVNALRRLMPNGYEVSVQGTEEVVFFDAGQNFERITCPVCHAAIELSWWQDRMDEDSRGQGFQLEKYVLPCCGARSSLNALTYDWPQAFGRFCAEVRNPNIGELGSEQRATIEQALGVPIVVVRRRV